MISDSTLGIVCIIVWFGGSILAAILLNVAVIKIHRKMIIKMRRELIDEK